MNDIKKSEKENPKGGNVKTYLIGLGLVCVGFCFGFLLACVLAASGRADAINREIEGEDLKQIKYLHDLIHGKSEGGDV